MPIRYGDLNLYHSHGAGQPKIPVDYPGYHTHGVGEPKAPVDYPGYHTHDIIEPLDPAELAQDELPIGQVLCWLNPETIPDGWTVADRQNGTADLTSLNTSTSVWIQRIR
jgi:hypothetical protein